MSSVIFAKDRRRYQNEIQTNKSRTVTQLPLLKRIKFKIEMQNNHILMFNSDNQPTEACEDVSSLNRIQFKTLKLTKMNKKGISHKNYKSKRII